MRRFVLTLSSLVLLLGAPLVLASGCGDDDGHPVCIETAAEFYEAAQRCGLSGSQGEIEDGLKCTQVVKIRDEKALREECFPALKTLDCNDLKTGNLPASCRTQLLIEQ